MLLPIISLLTNGEPEGRSGPSWYPRGGRSSSAARTNEQNGMGLEEAGRRWPAQGGAEPWLTFLSASVRTGETFVQLSIKVTWAREKRWLPLLLLLLPWLYLQNWVLVAWWRQNKKGGGGGEPRGWSEDLPSLVLPLAPLQPKHLVLLVRGRARNVD